MTFRVHANCDWYWGLISLGWDVSWHWSHSHGAPRWLKVQLHVVFLRLSLLIDGEEPEEEEGEDDA